MTLVSINTSVHLNTASSGKCVLLNQVHHFHIFLKQIHTFASACQGHPRSFHGPESVCRDGSSHVSKQETHWIDWCKAHGHLSGSISVGYFERFHNPYGYCCIGATAKPSRFSFLNIFRCKVIFFSLSHSRRQQ